LKGKPWPFEDEKKLRTWVEMGIGIETIVFSFEGKYTKEGIRQKMINLGLIEQQLEKTSSCSTPSDLPTELFSVKEALGLQMKAMKQLETSGLGKVEVMRLRCLIQAAVGYQERIAKYMDYRQLENDLEEYRKNYAELSVKYEELQTKFSEVGKKGVGTTSE
jgi:hypothetical protein